MLRGVKGQPNAGLVGCESVEHISEDNRNLSVEDVFENQESQPNKSISLVGRQAEEIKQLRAEKEQLLARIEQLEKQLGIAAVPGDSLDSVTIARQQIMLDKAQIEQKLSEAQQEYSRLADAADDQAAIAIKMESMGAKTTRMAAKMALQREAKTFEDERVIPLKERSKELQCELTKTAVRLTKVSQALPIATERIVNAFVRFLETPVNKDIANQIRDVLNPKPGMKVRELKLLLSPQLLKFLESQRPDQISLQEWVSYLGSSSSNDSRSILKHFGVDEIEHLLAAAEEHLSQEWKEKQPRGFHLPTL